MGWATAYIEKLRAGETVSFRPRGNSMSPKIESGQLCTVAPVDSGSIKKGDIVLCKVKGREYLHLVKAISGSRFQIGNNKGHINGWISENSIFGILESVHTERSGPMTMEETIMFCLTDLSSGAKAIELQTKVASMRFESGEGFDLDQYHSVLDYLISSEKIRILKYTHTPMNRSKSFFWIPSEDDVIQ